MPACWAQWRLYRAKTAIDLGVLLTQAATQWLREVAWALHLDPIGAVLMALVLLASGVRVLRRAVRDL